MLSFSPNVTHEMKPAADRFGIAQSLILMAIQSGISRIQLFAMFTDGSKDSEFLKRESEFAEHFNQVHALEMSTIAAIEQTKVPEPV